MVQASAKSCTLEKVDAFKVHQPRYCCTTLTHEYCTMEGTDTCIECRPPQAKKLTQEIPFRAEGGEIEKWLSTLLASAQMA